ncbi:MAG TPA: hypothetical protein VGO80_14300 [Solirubrobacteraceae bacterium]|nr:hypothetical protein [Solirubrobacteraceae bacterium]
MPLTFEQFRFGFGNAVAEEEARELYATFAVPASGEPIFQAAAVNLNPWTEAKVDTKNPERGPMLVIVGGDDHQAPDAIAEASFKKHQRNEGVTVRSLKGADTSSRSTAAGARSPTPRLRSSDGSRSAPRDGWSAPPAPHPGELQRCRRAPAAHDRRVHPPCPPLGNDGVRAP